MFALTKNKNKNKKYFCKKKKTKKEEKLVYRIRFLFG